MTRRSTPPPPDEVAERILDIDVAEEMRGSFLEYAYSVIYARAIPDARDGLKPVQRRILYQMAEMGLRPNRGHVKCARVVGDVMGRLHPHGDSAIYDALVRMAQPWVMQVPLVDGHGNFGSLDDGPAAYRYTECRLAPAAGLLTDSLDEDVVDMIPNYDGRETQPEVLPSAFPNLLVNGSSGIAVGMATNMPPHNLGEVIAATQHLIAHPDATVDDLMRFVPGPDLPTGGKIVGLEGIRDAYHHGRGTFRTRATATVEQSGRRRTIVVTELPYNVGPERVRSRIAELVRSKTVQGISGVDDFADRNSALRLVIEVKHGFVPEAVLEQLYRLTPLEETFGINNVALVAGQPRTLGLKDLLEVFIGHRLEVVRRRAKFRLGRRQDRLHLVEGLLVALLDIDEVIAVIRSSEDAAEARARLMSVFALSEVQATYILDTPLRRLTRYDRLELEREAATLNEEIQDLLALLADETRRRAVVTDELAQIARDHSIPRRTVLLESAGAAVVPARAASLEVADSPCHVLLSSTGRLARTAGAEQPGQAGQRARHDVIVSAVTTTARAELGGVTSRGRLVKIRAADLPVLPPTAEAPHLAGGAPIGGFVNLARDERVLALTSMDPARPGLALGTARGVVKRVPAETLATKDEWEVIRLEDADQLIGVAELRTGEEDLVFITSDAHLLRFGASTVRPQGRAAGGVAGIKVGDGARVVFFGAVDLAGAADQSGAVDLAGTADLAGAVGAPAGATEEPADTELRDRVPLVVTVSGSSAALPGTQAGSVKVTPLLEFPAKGRATGGVRAHRFLRGEDVLLLAWAGWGPPRAATADGAALTLASAIGRRDGSGVTATAPIDAVSGPLRLR